MPSARPLFLLIAICLTLTAFTSPSPLFAADKEKVLKYIWGSPRGGLIFDAAGNLYGTTEEGGILDCGYNGGCGTVFELTPQGDGTWKKTVLHNFTFREGGNPVASLVFDRAGNLYGTTTGCNPDGCNAGSVFELERQAGGKWKCKVLYRPGQPTGPLIFDQAGNLYGTASSGGKQENGSVFELTLHANGKWSGKNLYIFRDGNDGADGYYPVGGLVLDGAGNLYGVTCCGGHSIGLCYSEDDYGCGVVFELTPEAGGKWKEQVVHRFNGKDGSGPGAGLISDAAGNLYGSTQSGGNPANCDGYGCGVVFELIPQGGGKWTEKVLHNFDFSDGSDPNASLIFGSAGNLYGTTSFGGGPCFDSRGCGTAFELTPTKNGEWMEKVLFKFRGDDGAYPWSNLIFDSSGNLYGETFSSNRSAGPGTVFELSQ